MGDTIDDLNRATVKGVPTQAARPTREAAAGSGVKMRGKVLPVAKPLDDDFARSYPDPLEELLGLAPLRTFSPAKDSQPGHPTQQPGHATQQPGHPAQQPRLPRPPATPRRPPPGPGLIGAGRPVGLILATLMIFLRS